MYGSEIGYSELGFGEKIGEGTFGEVWRGTCRGKEVAIKKQKNPNNDEKVLNEFRKEIDIIRYGQCVRMVSTCWKLTFFLKFTAKFDILMSFYSLVSASHILICTW